MRRQNVAEQTFAQAVFPWFQMAAESNLPLFQPDVQGSNPLNSSPYLVDFASFRDAFGQSPRRTKLVDQLQSMVAELRTGGIEIIACMIGGSMVDRGREPRDIDCIAFYRCLGNPAEAGARLAQTARQRHPLGVDVRFVPVDSDPLILIKMTSYFTSLYSASRDGREPRFGQLLVLP